MKTEKLKVSVLFNTIGQFFVYVTPFLLAPYVSRVLMPEGVGGFSFGNSIAYYFSIFIAFGFTEYGAKKIAINRNDKNEYSRVFWNVFFVRLLFFLFSTALYLAFLFGGLFPDKISVQLYLSFLILFAGNAFDIYYLFQGLEKFKLYSIFNVITHFIYMGCVFILVKTPDDLLIYSICKLGIKLLLDCFLFAFSARLLSKPILDFSSFLKIIKRSFFFFVPSLVSTINPYIDQTMVGYFFSNTEVGYYQQSFKIVSLVSSFSFAIGPILLSRMSFLFSENKKEELIGKTTKMISLVSFVIFPAVAGLYCVSYYFIPAYFGESFFEALPVMYFFIPNILFNCFASIVINSYYYPFGRVKECTIIMALTVALNIIANLFVIPIMGAKGAALTSSSCGVISFSLLLILAKKDINFFRIIGRQWKCLISTALMVGILVTCNILFSRLTLLNSILITIFDIAIGIIVYLIACLITKENNMASILAIVFKKKEKTKE